MLITATEFKTNVSKYLALISKEDVIITKNGKQVARLTQIKDDKKTITDSLIGIIPDPNLKLTEIRKERLCRHESFD